MAKQVDVVVVGNRYLRDWYAEYAREVWILPTAIDSERFRPDERAATDPDRLVIGWIGSAATLRQLESIECALKEYFDIRPKDKLSVVSDREPRLPSLRAENVVFTSWSKESEVLSINNMDIGIMPLYDSVREKGKCAYKMLQYMACGKPVVASPVGMNGELFGLSNIGYPAVTKEDWVESLLALALSPEERGEQGGMGRDIVRRYYDKNVIGRAWVDMFSRLG
ncbi:glycosyltransferase family 4 protein [Thioalkalivibrio sp. ALE20]|uniref:glycosyltransferase family 4 protein n=1 Tax=Thioalkalivibrio sp. ALE20 TaxID=545275 RepID=UPI0018DD9922|nr:glycosyltransferase family 4 protein [Thioalkalivibrio sp. ALE20]